jgi:hypothetical protein
LYSLWNRYEKFDEGSLFCLFLKLVQINCIFTDSVRILYIYWYVLYNFWKYLFVKIAARVLAPDHIVTSLEHIDTVPGVQALTTSALCQVFKWRHYFARCSSDVTILPGVQVTSLFVLGQRHVWILLTNRYFQNWNTFR